MERKIKNKFFFWAIIFFGSFGIIVPIALRVIKKENEILILDEIILNLSTYAVALCAGEVYKGLLKNASSELSFKSQIFDFIGIIIGALIYLIVLNYILSLESNLIYLTVPISILGCLFAWILWYKTNDENSFGTGALGH